MEEQLKEALKIAVTALARIMVGADGPAHYIAKAALEEIPAELVGRETWE